ncbi:MAG TPA: UDP-N-acetylglucosamine--N-acetylmuramyl-(pentapeptide) pyrophosphoryl-undecaprenol N-acetylglucosamine transferase [bacterium]|nr:UDP-N-acetylglucosamine--N-acetylmuramyl-(pentapeptide) pyrophosphoryl-undecaprenol N-acetylglucosamine transferase [bacterium]
MDILIIVGSTGGHYFPAIAVGEKIKEFNPAINVWFAGEKKIKNLEIWKGKNFKAIPVLKKPNKKFLIVNSFIVAIFVFLKAITFLTEKKFRLIVCMGSYATVPIGITAFLMRKTVILHEANLLPGLANKILNVFGVPAAITFPETCEFLNRTTHTGFPIRKDFLSSEKNYERYGLIPDKFTILALGGSQGARFINQVVCASVPLLDPLKYQIIHLTGKKDYHWVKSFYEGETITAYVVDFTYEIPHLMNLADIAIARAGSGTIAELSFKAIPSILIPYPFASGHQKFNALYAEKKGCIMIEQQKANPQMIFNAILKMQFDIEERKKLFSSLGICDVSGNFAKMCLTLINKNG